MGGASALAAVSEPSDLVDTAASEGIRTPSDDHWDIDGPSLSHRIGVRFQRLELLGGSSTFKVGIRLKAYGEVAESG